MSQKIIRSVCLFTDIASGEDLQRLTKIADSFGARDFEIQTKRLCSPDFSRILELDKSNDGNLYFSVGELDYDFALKNLDSLLNTKNVSFNTDLTSVNIEGKHITLLDEIIKKAPQQTFNFTYTFNNPASSPYFPSAVYKQNGFSIGLQPTNLAEDCQTLEEWLEKISKVWAEIVEVASSEPDFLGIDSSIAPVFSGSGSLVNFIKRLGLDFNRSITTDAYLKITEHIKTQNPKPTGLCGLMFPCLEDFELTDEYEKGDFSIERNVFLALHSGLGIDTYPVGVDERPERLVEILRLVQGLSNKYKKPLSARFVSDGKAKIGQKSNFQNQYLKDVTIRSL